MGKELATKVQEVQRATYSINPRRNMLRHTVIKLEKLKTKKNIESSKGKTTNNIQGNSHKVNS